MIRLVLENLGRKYFSRTSWTSAFHSFFKFGATDLKSRAQDGLLELICCFIQYLQEYAVFVPELKVGLFF